MSNPVSAISGGVSLIGGISGSNSSKKAAQQQAQSAADATAEDRRQYDTSRADLAPYRNAGYSALDELSMRLGLGTGQNQNVRNAQSEYDAALDALTRAQSSIGSNNAGNDYLSRTFAPSMLQMTNPFTGSAGGNVDLSQYQQRLDAAKAGLASAQNTPSGASTNPNFGSLLKKFDYNDLNNDVVYQNGLQFGLDEGRNALSAQLRAAGSMGSGRALKDLTRYGNDYATTKTNDAYNRFTNDNTNIFNKLSGVAGTGQNAVNTGIQAGLTSSNNISNNLLNAGNARSAGTIGSNNAWSTALSGIAKQFGSGSGGSGNASTGIDLNKYLYG